MYLNHMKSHSWVRLTSRRKLATTLQDIHIIMVNKKVYFLTGANRGIGFQLAKAISSQKDALLIATTRDPTSSTDLNILAEKQGNVKVIKLDVSSEESIQTLDKILPKVAPEGIDYFVSNAGIAKASAYHPVLEVKKPVWIDHYTTNVLGPILLTQKLHPYLIKRQTRVIHVVSSMVGSIGGYMPANISAYGQSKAAINYTINTLAFELGPTGFKVVAVSPGFVDTDMGNSALVLFEGLAPETATNLKSIQISAEETATKQLVLMNGYTSKDNGKFYSFDGTPVPW